jgi:Domain of unknown function (DUF4193)
MSTEKEELYEDHSEVEVEDLDLDASDDVVDDEDDDELTAVDEDDLEDDSEDSGAEDLQTEGEGGEDDEEEDTDSTSLEELLARRSAARRGSDSEDDADIMSFPSDRARDPERLSVPVTPLKDRQEFVCRSCYLVKPRVQLADPERMYCRDCV